MIYLSYIFTLCCIYLPIILYPIPYINPKWIPQEYFIPCCQLRIVLLCLSFCIYNLLQEKQSFFSVSPTAILFGCLLFLTGQFLNRSVYRILGTEGVYYGIQYGTVVPQKIKTDCFPFCLKHPLYIGGCLSYLGILLLTFWKENGMDTSILFLWYNVEMVQFSLMLMEDIFDSI